MTEVVLKVEKISKQYRLGELGTGTLSHDLNRWWHHVRGKEDPYLKVGDVNDRSQAGGSDYVWSLRDITFQVKRGEVLGIIGKNGAGKSTLLKILSQVTTPTTGEVKVRGRIAALLEVGTGFHPELTGRENIFLNGAILGMTKQEIRSKLDEIVDFSGVAKYLDTPVKRYSSGMKVRLGFAVAAHLEPEILIVDEVLAVGDAEFQSKCIGKMKDVSGSGRTVLFVSHNLQAVRSLCDKALYLERGRVRKIGDCGDVLSDYITDHQALVKEQAYKANKVGQVAFLSSLSLHDVNGKEKYEFSSDEDIVIHFELVKNSEITGMYAYFGIQRADETLIIETDTREQLQNFLDTRETGVFNMRMIIPKRLLNNGVYLLNYGIGSKNHSTFQIESLRTFLRFHVISQSTSRDSSRKSILSFVPEWKLITVTKSKKLL